MNDIKTGARTPLALLLAQFEASVIKQALQECNGNRAKAAALLGCNRTRCITRSSVWGWQRRKKTRTSRTEVRQSGHAVGPHPVVTSGDTSFAPFLFEGSICLSPDPFVYQEV
jgi:uncharacterized iron-regulated membrane protein